MVPFFHFADKDTKILKNYLILFKIHLIVAKKKSKKNNIPADFQRQANSKLIRNHRKTILFNDKEMLAIENYCNKYGIRSKSSFIRNAVISHILVDMDENYPKLF